MRITNREMNGSRRVGYPRAGLTAAALVALGACGGGGDPPGPAVMAPPPLAPLPTADRIYYDNSGAVADAVREVLRDRAAFEAAWTRATSRQTSPPPPPAVDFDEKMAVMVGAGRMTPEDQIHVDSVGIRRVSDADGEPEDILAVVVRTTVGCGRFNVDAYPVEIALVPRFAGEVRFVERRDRDPSCGLPIPAGL